MNLKTNDFVTVLPLDSDDARVVAKMRLMAALAKGVPLDRRGRRLPCSEARRRSSFQLARQ
jgi:hypothetical protein